MRGTEFQMFAGTSEISESENGLEFTTALPGIEREDLVIELLDGALMVRARRKGANGHEASRGAFLRRLPLPFEVPAEAVQARFSDGVLRVSIPRLPPRPVEPQMIALQRTG